MQHLIFLTRPDRRTSQGRGAHDEGGEKRSENPRVSAIAKPGPAHGFQNGIVAISRHVGVRRAEGLLMLPMQPGAFAEGELFRNRQISTLASTARPMVR
jgi:hypothetical protein